VLGVVGRLAGAIETPLGTIVLAAGAGAVLNALVGMINERGWYRWWFIYMLAVLDVGLVTLLVVWFGHGGVVAALFIAVLPYAFDQGQAVGDFLVLVTSVAYLGMHVRSSEGVCSISGASMCAFRRSLRYSG